MKVNFTLNDRHESILLALLGARDLRLKTLEDIVDAIQDSANPFTSLVRLVAEKMEKERKSDPLQYQFLRQGLYRSIAEEDDSEDASRKFTEEVDGLVFLGLIERSASRRVHLTQDGERIARTVMEGRHVILRPHMVSRSQVFAACAFGHEDVDQMIECCVAPEIHMRGYALNRIDLTEPTQNITSAILEGIVEAACVVADLTYARPSVYFEIGFAHGLGVSLLLTCREDHYRGVNDQKRVHFDLEQYKISYWGRTDKGVFRWKKRMSPKDRLASLLPSRQPPSEMAENKGRDDSESRKSRKRVRKQ